ncbi:phosphoribosyl-AMP cyclohydrolase [Alteromonas lipolytica]|uniref:Phosphoribosyl-AMP cyclohydrolase n=1 Tax=Alteromonas lipolytica TaxID=1856405 RepID=A0A1E8FHC4_9ALTE|nr:phosphoribosyl-AMP cyclohydrolase [Alteromonas lipolytica]OFI35335.1 phosphoribosyl-AMP cyclohydrolase [Alteromonas lipolytica]GGF52974.1 phosphoribosyl-AMP cyclohydrolase [Alteromonas lipolytica]
MQKMNVKMLVALSISSAVLTGCATAQSQQLSKNLSEPVASNAPVPMVDNRLLYSDACISEREVVEAQKLWGEGIVRIGSVFSSNGDYKTAAADFIQDMYGYDLSSVLFKPTLAAKVQFRSSFDAALSYFVGGNDAYSEDKGFAIKPYTKVKFDNVGIINNSCSMAVAMGNYYFTDTNGGETKVEYTFAYVKDKAGKVRIVAHQSSLPYSPS